MGKNKKIILCILFSFLVISGLILAYILPKESKENEAVSSAAGVLVQETASATETEIAEDNTKENTEIAPQKQTEKAVSSEAEEQKAEDVFSEQPENTKPSPVPSQNQTEEVEGKNQTQSVHEKPIVEKSKTEKTEKLPLAEKNTNQPQCILSVRCDDILNNMEKISENKRDFIPENGIILSERIVYFSEGESAFDILKKELKDNHIPMEFVQNPMYQSAYIEGIAHIYEFDCGSTSGWVYTVNGKKPNYGCSKYQLQNGDKVEFFYQCSLY